jgi:NTE family protein
MNRSHEHPAAPLPMSTAFVLSGGGSLGAVQVGMLQALAERGVVPDLLVGTSVGAVNAAWVAGHGMSTDSLAALARLWTDLRRQDVFPLSVPHAVAALTGRRSALSSSSSLRALLTANVGIGDLAEAVVPLHVVATDLLSGEEVLLSAGGVVPAVLASAAIPGVFPPVPIDGRHLVDGGVADHTAVSQAVGLGASEIYVLPAGYPCARGRAPASALGVAVQALTLLIEQRLIVEVAGYAGAATIKVLPPLCPLTVSAADFSHGAELVDRGHRATAAWLDEGGVDLPRQERFLSLHRHDAQHGEHAVAAADRRMGRRPARR